jgi:hypothetical protein
MHAETRKKVTKEKKGRTIDYDVTIAVEMFRILASSASPRLRVKSAGIVRP